jgi:hypothetical protein
MTSGSMYWSLQASTVCRKIVKPAIQVLLVEVKSCVLYVPTVATSLRQYFVSVMDSSGDPRVA